MMPRFLGLAAVVTLGACAPVQTRIPEESSPFQELVSQLTSDLLEERDSALRELCRKGLPAISAVRSAQKKSRNMAEAELLSAALEIVVSKYVGSLGVVAFYSNEAVWTSRLDGTGLKAVPGARESQENAFRPEAFTPEGELIIDSRDGLYSAAAPSWDLRPMGPRHRFPKRVIFDRSACRWRFGDELLVQDQNPFYGLQCHREGKWTELERTRTEFTSVAVWDYQIARDKTGRVLVASAYSCRDAPQISVIDPQRLGLTSIHKGKPADGVVFQWNSDESLLAVIVGQKLFTWDGSTFKPIFEYRQSLRSVSWSASGRRLALIDWRDQLHVIDLEGRLLWTHSFFRPVDWLEIDVAWIDDERFGVFWKRSNQWSQGLEEHSLLLMDSSRRSILDVGDEDELVFGKLLAVRRPPGLIYYKITDRIERPSKSHSELFAGPDVRVDFFFYSVEDSRSYRISRTGLLQGEESHVLKTGLWDPTFFIP